MTWSTKIAGIIVASYIWGYAGFYNQLSDQRYGGLLGIWVALKEAFLASDTDTWYLDDQLT